MGFSSEQLRKQAERYNLAAAPKTIEVDRERGVLAETGARVFGGALKILDQIQRPYYGLMNVGKDIADKGEFNSFKSFYRGVTLKDKTEFSDIMSEVGWQPESLIGKITKAGVSFVGSVVLDPITYLGFGVAKGVMLAGKSLSKSGTRVYLKALSKKFGVKLKTVEDIGKYSAKIDPVESEKIGKQVVEFLYQDPDKYFNKSVMKYMGKEMPKATNAIKDMGRVIPKALKPILNTPVGRGIKTATGQTARTIGHIFEPHYGVKASRHLTPAQKAKFLGKIEDERNLLAWKQAENIEDTRRTFKKMGKKEREQVVFELEEFLKNPKRLLSDIKDERVRKVVGTFQEKMDDIWQEEIKTGAREAGKGIDKGYVWKTLKKSLEPENINTDFYKSRDLAALTVKEAKEKFKEGKLSYMFETDAAKVYAGRVNKSNVMIMRKQLAGWLEENSFIKPLKSRETTKGMVTLDKKIWGKDFEALPEIARELKTIRNDLTDVGIKKFLQKYDEVQNMWKLSVTSLWPSFHARNAVSNVWLGWLGGNKSLGNYQIANKLQWYGHNLKAGKDVAKVGDKTIKLGNFNWKISQLWEEAGKSGVVGTGWFGGDFLKKLAISKKDLSTYTNLPRRFGTAVENNARISLFVDRLAKGDDITSAAKHTKKFLFDYGDLTQIERKGFKRAVPFYTWMRKNIPLQLEQIAKQPGKYAAMTHGQKAVESMTPAMEEKYLPHWMKNEEMYIRLPGNKYFNPDLPFQDLAKLTLSDRTIKEIVNPITPLVKGVMEIAANRDIFRGKPLADQRLPKNRLALEKIKQELLNNMRFTSVYKRAKKEDRTLFKNFLDFVLGIKITPFDTAQGRKFYKQEKIGELRVMKNVRKWYQL